MLQLKTRNPREPTLQPYNAGTNHLVHCKTVNSDCF